MDKGRAIAVLVDALEIDDELAWIVLGVGHDLRREEGNNMVRNDLAGFALEVRVVDAKVCVEPIDLASDEFAGNKALDTVLAVRIDGIEQLTLAATSCSTSVRCSSLPLNTGVV